MSHGKLVRLVFFYVVILLAMVNPATATVPGITFYTVEDGMSGNIVNCIVKDASGFIWISQKDNTISRFDGYGFTNYPPDEYSGWNGFQCFRGGLQDLEQGNFLVSSRSSVARYDILSNRFFDYLQEIYNENPGIQQAEGQVYLVNEIIWFFENSRIRKLEPEEHPAMNGIPYDQHVFVLLSQQQNLRCTSFSPLFLFPLSRAFRSSFFASL